MDSLQRDQMNDGPHMNVCENKTALLVPAQSKPKNE